MRKTLNQVYLEKYGTTWGLSDIEKYTFDYKEVSTYDLIKLLIGLTKNPEWIFAGNHFSVKVNQIVHALRNELYSRPQEERERSFKKQTPSPEPERERERNYNTVEYQTRSTHNNHSYRDRERERELEPNYNR